MMGHKICFYGEIWLIIPKLTPLLLLQKVVKEYSEDSEESKGGLERCSVRGD